MKPSVEFLFHCACDKCHAWWTQADLLNLEHSYCPHCGHKNTVELPVAHGISEKFKPEYRRAIAGVLREVWEEIEGSVALHSSPQSQVKNDEVTSGMEIKLDAGDDLVVISPRGNFVFHWSEDRENLLVATSFNPDTTVPSIDGEIGEELDEEDPQHYKRVCRMWLSAKQGIDDSQEQG
ncbi:hypothetical protein [Leptolyngbya sp. FACHB-16]|uniref:hypothetical protein n=1 Tax=unclassified Leptolyngbya TaxID=2650499 RepID=UPI001682DB2E|nr:hypothetical protein [Leptolyngbya sp. FACHB-16]MBD2156264.1 hypothetical protein [Leptolyngbya sp. FACHB-16]